MTWCRSSGPYAGQMDVISHDVQELHRSGSSVAGSLAQDPAPLAPLARMRRSSQASRPRGRRVSRTNFVVVGAGSAGCVLANRLSADPTQRVLLLEAGGGDSHPLIRMPLAWHAAAHSKRFDWGYVAEPEDAILGRALHQPRGRLLGGTSSINGMMYSRGNRGDYDGWARMGCRLGTTKACCPISAGLRRTGAAGRAFTAERGR